MYSGHERQDFMYSDLVVPGEKPSAGLAPMLLHIGTILNAGEGVATIGLKSQESFDPPANILNHEDDSKSCSRLKP